MTMGKTIALAVIRKTVSRQRASNIHTMAAKTVITTFSQVSSATNAKATTAIAERLNGYDPTLRPGAVLWLLSDSLKEEKRKNRSGIEYNAQYFYVIDEERGLVKVSRSALAGGMGYLQCPDKGAWKPTDDGKWFILHPQEEDEARKTLVSWGMSSVFPAAFVLEGSILRVPKLVKITITACDYVSGRGPLDSQMSPDKLLEAQSDTSFRPNSVKRWQGEAHYPTQQELEDLVSKHNTKFPENPLDIAAHKELLVL